LFGHPWYVVCLSLLSAGILIFPFVERLKSIVSFAFYVGLPNNANLTRDAKAAGGVLVFLI
jgi:hypothetical protein